MAVPTAQPFADWSTPVFNGRQTRPCSGQGGRGRDEGIAPFSGAGGRLRALEAGCADPRSPKGRPLDAWRGAVVAGRKWRVPYLAFTVLQQVYTTDWCRPCGHRPRSFGDAAVPLFPCPRRRLAFPSLRPGGPPGGSCVHGQRRSRGCEEEGLRRDGCLAAHRPQPDAPGRRSARGGAPGTARQHRHARSRVVPGVHNQDRRFHGGGRQRDSRQHGAAVRRGYRDRLREEVGRLHGPRGGRRLPGLQERAGHVHRQEPATGAPRPSTARWSWSTPPWTPRSSAVW